MLLSTVDPRLLFLNEVEIQNCKVEFENHIILLCGGVVDIKSATTTSLRDAILRQTAHSDKALYDAITMAEEYTDWLHDATYQDLMEFENDLASIASQVVLLLESAGSIAELGAFSQNSRLSEKLLVVVPSEHHANDSFIKLGILRLLCNKNNSSVRIYPWNIKDPSQIPPEITQDVIKDISLASQKFKASSKFDKENSGHLMVLIKEIIRIFLAVKFGEIANFLELIGVNGVDSNRLKRCLFVLEKIQAVNKIPYSDKEFYVVSVNKFHSVLIRSKTDEKSIDSHRVMFECRGFYEASNDTHRMRVITNVFGGKS